MLGALCRRVSRIFSRGGEIFKSRTHIKIFARSRAPARRTAASSPLGTLSGSDNLVEVYTQWYNDNPLVLRGAGAGTGATAAGVLADMLDLAYTAA